jgi:hypothetical protein
MSRTIEAIMAHLMRVAERPVAPTYKINPTARWQTGLETISGNTQWKVRLEKIKQRSKRLISTAGCLIVLTLAQGSLAGANADPADEKALQERNETFVSAFNKGTSRPWWPPTPLTAIFSRRTANG